MNKKVKSVLVKAEISKDDMINLYLDLILIWNNSKDKTKKEKINKYVNLIRDLRP